MYTYSSIIVSNLPTLNKDNNNLSGTIPAALAQLPLETLFLQDNFLVGTIPSEFGHSPSHVGGTTLHRWINLDNNALQGTLPDFTASPNLSMFNAANNELTGTIPTSFLIRNIWYIHLNNNMLTGTIPKSSEPMPALRELLLHNNSLTGDFIPHNGAYGARKQTYHDNYIYGEVDPAICDSLSRLRSAYQLTSDCLRSSLQCNCCTNCYNGKRVTVTPSIAPSTRIPTKSIAPSPRPTRPSPRPTSIPTKSSRPSIQPTKYPCTPTYKSKKDYSYYCKNTY